MRQEYYPEPTDSNQHRFETITPPAYDFCFEARTPSPQGTSTRLPWRPSHRATASVSHSPLHPFHTQFLVTFADVLEIRAHERSDIIQSESMSILSEHDFVSESTRCLDKKHPSVFRDAPVHLNRSCNHLEQWITWTSHFVCMVHSMGWKEQALHSIFVGMHTVPTHQVNHTVCTSCALRCGFH